MAEINESEDLVENDAPAKAEENDLNEQAELDTELDNKYNDYIAEGTPINSELNETNKNEEDFKTKHEKKYSTEGNESEKAHDLKEGESYQEELPEVFNGFNEEKKQKNIEALSKMSDSERANYLGMVAKEPGITKDVKELTEANGGELAGLEARVKTPASTYEKMYDREEKTDLRDMNDVIRYTEIYEPDKLADATNNNLDQFKEKGYSIDRVKNTWEDDETPYRGINVNMTSPEGQKFEVQYHTQESFELKNGEMHTKYEECRTLNPESERYCQLQDEMYELSDKLEKPKDIGKVENR